MTTRARVRNKVEPQHPISSDHHPETRAGQAIDALVDHLSVPGQAAHSAAWVAQVGTDQWWESWQARVLDCLKRSRGRAQLERLGFLIGWADDRLILAEHVADLADLDSLDLSDPPATHGNHPTSQPTQEEQ